MRDTRPFIDVENNLDGGLHHIPANSLTAGPQVTPPDPTCATQNSSPTSTHMSTGGEMATYVSDNPFGQSVSTVPGSIIHSAIPHLRRGQLGGIVEAIISFLYRHPVSRVSVDIIQHVLMLCMERACHDFSISAPGVPNVDYGLSGPSDRLGITSYHTHAIDTSIWPFSPELATSHVVSDMVSPFASSGQVPGVHTSHEAQVPSGGHLLVNFTERPYLPRGFSSDGQAVKTPAQQFNASLPPYSDSPEHHCTDLSRVPIASARGRRFVGPRTVCTLCNLVLSRDGLRRHIRERHEGKKRKVSRKKV